MDPAIVVVKRMPTLTDLNTLHNYLLRSKIQALIDRPLNVNLVNASPSGIIASRKMPLSLS